MSRIINRWIEAWVGDSNGRMAAFMFVIGPIAFVAFWLGVATVFAMAFDWLYTLFEMVATYRRIGTL